MDRSLNTSELATLIRGSGVPAHRGMGWQRLMETWTELQETGIAEGEVNPIDDKRREMMEYITRHKDVLLPQLGCDGNCYAHPDVQVVLCWLRKRGKIPL